MTRRLVLGLLVFSLLVPATAFAGRCCCDAGPLLSVHQEDCCQPSFCLRSQADCPMNFSSARQDRVAVASIRSVLHPDTYDVSPAVFHNAATMILARRGGESFAVPPVSTPHAISLPLRL